MYLEKETFKNDFKRKLISLYRESVEDANDTLKYMALGSLIKDYMANDWHETEVRYEREQRKQVYYFSLEYLIGRLMDASLVNLGIRDVVEAGLKDFGVELKSLEEVEPDAGLGNGGLGRLAACFIDSMASLGIAGMGVGIRYKFGLFQQQIYNGYQIESPDNWLKIANVWETRRDDEACMVRFGGTVESNWGDDGKMHVTYKDYEPILAVPYDMPVPGYCNGTVNTLRLWSAETDGPGFDFAMFSKGDHERAIQSKTNVDAITNVLYPDDSTPRGKQLRLKQEYFFTSAGIQSILRKIKKSGISLYDLHNHVAIQINDTHPALAVPELMRILIDEEGFNWDDAWAVTNKTLGYTNHTILAEALEKWNIDMFKKLLPRVYMIVEEINRRFTSDLYNRYNGDWNRINRMSVINDGVVKMAHLAIVGSHSVNGVAELHTEILKNVELKKFYDLYPDKFNNKTNGITFRRWLIAANPDLTELIRSLTGDGFLTDADRLKDLAMYENDADVLSALDTIKTKNKLRLKEFLMKKEGIVLREDSVFDIQAKRLHEYKRQQLNALYIIKKYLDIKDGKYPDRHLTFIFAAKAAPSYTMAKDIIHLILCLSKLIAADPVASEYMTVVMIENYNVTVAEKLIPACDISEQISLASKEASGTGNMKFMLNGAVTLGTLDGANVEIADFVGKDNIYIFGKSAEEVIALYKSGRYNPRALYSKNADIRRAVDFISDTAMLKIGDGTSLRRLQSDLINKDYFMALLDFEDYSKTKDKAFADYENRTEWARKTLVNISKARYFSSDRTVAEYNKDIWKL